MLRYLTSIILLAVSLVAWGADFPGQGTAASPYVISTPAQLQALAQNVNAGNSYRGNYFTLGADISLSDLAQWQPIGADPGHRFAGSFDGAGHAISGLKLQYAARYGGLFGVADTASSITNLTLSSFNLQCAGWWCGALAGASFGTISKISVVSSQVSCDSVGCGGIVGRYWGPMMTDVTYSGAVSGCGYVGGIVGQLRGTLQNAATLGGVRLVAIVDYTRRGVGGIVGSTSAQGKIHPVIRNACNQALVLDQSGNGDLGGLVGELFSGSLFGGMNAGLLSANVRNAGSQTQPDGAVGGLVGTTWNAWIQDCLNANAIKNAQPSTKVGGLVGYARVPLTTIYQGDTTYSYFTHLERCYNSGQVTVPNATTPIGLVGTTYSDSIFTHCYFDVQITPATAIEGTALSTRELTTSLPEGFTSDVWTAQQGLYPQLTALAQTDASRLAAAPLILAEGQNSAKVKTGFTVSTTGGVKWSIYKDGQLTTSDAALTIDGDTVRLSNVSATETLVASVGNLLSKQVVVTTVNPNGLRGQGTQADPYLVSDENDLLTIDANVTGNGQSFAGDYFVQTNDIHLTDTTTFRGIGSDNRTSHQFGGHYDGRGYSIHNFRVSNASRTNAALFGFLKAGGSVSGVVLAADCSVSGGSYAAGIVAHNAGTVDSCFNLAPISAAKTYAGGITAYNEATATVTRCYNEGNITAAQNHAAGITCYNLGTISGCQNSGDILARQQVAAGIANENYKASALTGCVNGSAVTAPTLASGIVSTAVATSTVADNVSYGYVTIDDPGSTAQGAISASTFAAHGTNNRYDAQLLAIGAVANAPSPAAVPCNTADLLVDNQYPVAVSGPKATVRRAMVVRFATGESSQDLATAASLSAHEWKLQQGTRFNINQSTLQASVAATDTTSLRDTLLCTAGGYSLRIPVRTMPVLFAGKGTSQDPYLITNVADFNRLARITNEEHYPFGGKHFRMTNDIDYTDATFTPVAMGGNQLNAEFNGGGHQLLGVTYDGGKQEWTGIFGNIGAQGAVRRLILGSGTLSQQRYAAGIAGKVWGTVDSCINRATVKSSRYLGAAGISAQVLPGGVISRCRNEGTVLATGTFSAGIVCLVQQGAVVTDCENASSFTDGKHSGVAGIASVNYGTVQHCRNLAPLSGTGTVGGIVQESSGNDSIIDCHNLAAISATGSMVGGILAQSGTKATGTVITACTNQAPVQGKSMTGGIAGRLYAGVSVSHCSNSAAITGLGGYYTGGIVGYASGDDGSIADCTNTGTVSATAGTYLGGIAGYLSDYGLLRCHNRADVTAAGSNVGGLAARAGGAITDCSNSGNISSTNYAVGGLVGQALGVTLLRCYNLGDVTSGGNTSARYGNAGGLMAYGSFSATDCYNMGTVSAPNGHVGGLAGNANNGAALHRCYNAGPVIATTDSTTAGPILGALVSGVNVTADSVYFDDVVATTAALGTPLSTKALTQAALGDAFTHATACYPVLNPADTLAQWHAATVLLADGDTWQSVAHKLTIGTPEGVAWTSSPNLSISGTTVATTALGEAWLTKTYGTHQRTYKLNVTALSGIDEISNDAQVVGVDYYDLQGRRLTHPSSGITLQVTRYAGGKVTTEKVLNK